MEIISGVERRRRWRIEDKLRILAEIDALVGRWASEREAGEGFGDFVIRAGIVKPVIDSARDFYD